MEFVTIVIVLALLQYMGFAALVGRAREKYNVPAPESSGHPVFERYYRVHQNTLESLIMFLPGMVMFAWYIDENLAALTGLVYLIGRFVYWRAYVGDPKRRALGYMLTIIPVMVLLFGGGIGALLALLQKL